MNARKHGIDHNLGHIMKEMRRARREGSKGSLRTARKLRNIILCKADVA